MKNVRCDFCFHHCLLTEGQSGFCHTRKLQDNQVVNTIYGKISSMAIDPIEKKPLRRFYPGSKILSVGSYGCTMRCPFCQNYAISMEAIGNAIELSAEELVRQAEAAKQWGSIGIAFTYNEPLLSYEYILECAKLAKQKDLKIVIVSNGMIEEAYLKRLLPYVDAMNIDLKGFREDIYAGLQGSLRQVMTTISSAVSLTHVEITSLIVPHRNTDEQDMIAQCDWLASLDVNIPLHITRYFPAYHQSDPPTDIALLQALMTLAQRKLNYVYKGNW